MAHNAEAAPSHMINPLCTEPDEETRSQERVHSRLPKGKGKALCSACTPQNVPVLSVTHTGGRNPEDHGTKL